MVPLLENPSFFGLVGGRVVGNAGKKSGFYLIKNDYIGNEIRMVA